MRVQRSLLIHSGQDSRRDAAVQYDFPEAAIRYTLRGRIPNRPFAASVSNVSVADFAALRNSIFVLDGLRYSW